MAEKIISNHFRVDLYHGDQTDPAWHFSSMFESKLMIIDTMWHCYEPINNEINVVVFYLVPLPVMFTIG